ncbi:MAG: alpha-glucosidase C-terminal domain-containing protein, partial [Bryobacterales bacterium]|nr:alpha-glucosidase C-terminal domain-containing protein [Bryobacterales bacterium]
DCTYLARWAASLQTPSEVTTFFNFLDSHDGVGLLPVRTILTREEVQQLVDRTYAHGGLVSMRTNSDGTSTPYELNIPWYNALNNENQGESADTKIDRFLVSRAIALSLKGVAAVYLPSVIGAHVTAETPVDIRDPRSINRNTINTPALFAQLADTHSPAYRISQRFTHMISVRIACAAFHPAAPQRVIFATPRVFAFVRERLDKSAMVLCLNNITNEPQHFEATIEKLRTSSIEWEDILTREQFLARNEMLQVELRPYQVRWLRARMRPAETGGETARQSTMEAIPR